MTDTSTPDLTLTKLREKLSYYDAERWPDDYSTAITVGELRAIVSRLLAPSSPGAREDGEMHPALLAANEKDATPVPDRDDAVRFAKGYLKLCEWKPGRYEVYQTAGGKSRKLSDVIRFLLAAPASPGATPVGEREEVALVERTSRARPVAHLTSVGVDPDDLYALQVAALKSVAAPASSGPADVGQVSETMVERMAMRLYEWDASNGDQWPKLWAELPSDASDRAYCREMATDFLTAALGGEP